MRLLQAMMVAAIVLPAMLFALAAWVNYRSVWNAADERIQRSLDILHEHALKVFQTVDLAIDQTEEIVRDYSNDEIVAHEYDLSRRLKHIDDRLTQIQSIWVFDPKGQPLVSSLIYPLANGMNFADRDYFSAPSKGHEGTYVSEMITARVGPNPGYFFDLSRRRHDAANEYAGVTAVSVFPRHFEEFYARLGNGTGNYYALVRYDGVFLARFPIPRNRAETLGAQSAIRRSIVDEPIASIYTVVAQTDGIERRIGYRKLVDFPVYVLAGIETATISGEWLSLIATQLLFGIPVTLLLVVIIGIALQRTRRLHAEAERRETAEDGLRQAQRLEAIGQLTGGVAHDFNNLLMVVSGSVQRLRRDITDPKHARSFEMIMTATQRGESLTRQLLSFSRRQMLSPSVIDLSKRIPELKELLARSLRGDITIRVDVPSEACAVRVDPSEFELAILNLAVNARDAMPNGGKLNIVVRRVRLRGDEATDGLAGEFVGVRLTDTGTGMDPEILPRVFEPFFTTKEVGKGTGLGLSQVYGFARQSGGTAVVTSRPQHGTSITLYLPATSEQPSVAATASIAIAESPPANTAGAVLVVEDNPEVAEVCSAYFEQLGYRVKWIPGGQAALEFLATKPSIDLVFSDILMPGSVNGLDLGCEIRNLYPKLPVLLTTGYSTSAQTALLQGFVVLQKPYNLDTLKKRLREIASLAARQRSPDSNEPSADPTEPALNP